jgi:thioredoxin-related protein
MDTVTYPDPKVRAELTRWLEHRVDVTEDRELATLFEIAAIPTAVLVDAEGRVLDRVVGFVKPGDFLKRLEAARGQE